MVLLNIIYPLVATQITQFIKLANREEWASVAEDHVKLISWSDRKSFLCASGRGGKFKK